MVMLKVDTIAILQFSDRSQEASQQHALLMPLRGVGFELPLLATPVEEFLVIKGLG